SRYHRSMANASKIKSRALRSISKAIGLFYPELRGIFICPTCLDHVPLTKQDTVSVAHILPRSCGGTRTTYLCRSCNSAFGTAQDKWLGEYVEQSKVSFNPLRAKHQSGSFTVNDVKVNGRYHVRDDGVIEFIGSDGTNSPDTIRKVHE